MCRILGLLTLLTLLMSCSGHHGHGGHHKHHRFSDAQRWQKVFENKKRDKWQKPMQVIKAAGVKSNSLVADIGSGTGYFPTRLAKIAKKGRVWGSDIEVGMVNFLNLRARKENIKNLFSIRGTFDDPLLPEPVNFIFMVNTYHHISKREQYFKKLQSKLLKNGKVLIVDFKKKELPFGPPMSMKLSKQDIINEMIEAGYELYKDEKILEYQNLLIFQVK